MTPTRRTRPTTAQLPTSIWLPTPHTADLAPTAPAVLPDWAIDKIRTEFTRRPGHLPAPLLRLHISDTSPGMDARTPCTTYTDSADDAPGTTKPVLLAELHPDTLPAPGDPLTGGPMPGAIDEGWPGFFHRAHRLLPDGGVLLLATRQRRDAGRLTDPLGALIACARTAGFTYLQHIVIVHAHPIGDHLVPAPPGESSPDLIHSDLIVLNRR